MVFFRRREARQSAIGRDGPCAPKGARAFAIGDIHGRLDLAELLLERIQAIRRDSPCARDYLVLLGDLIDRGADSAGVIEWAMSRLPDDMIVVCIAGNHEEMMVRVLSGESDLIWDWLDFGGYEFAQSYGVEVGNLSTMRAAQAVKTIRAAVPESHIAFVREFVDSFRFGDYLFVHAGIRPGLAIDRQEVRDLRWIRAEFLSSEADHGCIVVHGHTISAEPEELPNRIGIDTGAYATGILTALQLSGGNRSFISVSQKSDDPVWERR